MQHPLEPSIILTIQTDSLKEAEEGEEETFESLQGKFPSTIYQYIDTIFVISSNR